MRKLVAVVALAMIGCASLPAHVKRMKVAFKPESSVEHLDDQLFICGTVDDKTGPVDGADLVCGEFNMVMEQLMKAKGAGKHPNNVNYDNAG